MTKIAATVGLDIGNITSIGYCEDKHYITESRIDIPKNIDELASDEIFTFNGEQCICNRGDFENNYIKYDKSNFLKLTFFTASKVTDKNIIDIAIGIPAGQYSSKRAEMKKFLENNRTQTINNRTITLRNIEIIPEGFGLKVVGALKECDEGIRTILIDIGGGTTDISEFDQNGKFVTGKYIKYGLLDLYSDTRIALDERYNVTANIAEAKRIFDGDEKYRTVDNSYKASIMKNAIVRIVNDLRGMYPNLMNYNIVLTGGGAKKLYPTFKKLYSHTILVDDITANAKGFYKIGAKLWQKR